MVVQIYRTAAFCNMTLC